jgi:hypothetical protein
VEEREKRGKRREGCETGRRHERGQSLPNGGGDKQPQPSNVSFAQQQPPQSATRRDPVRARYSRTQRRGTPAHSFARISHPDGDGLLAC